MYIGYFCPIDIKRGYRYTAGNIIPVAHYIFICLAHGKSTTLYKDETGTCLLVLGFGYLETAHVLVVVVPASYI